MGKVIQCSLLTATELNKLTSEVANVDVSKCVLYSQLLLCYVEWCTQVLFTSEARSIMTQLFVYNQLKLA